MKHRRLELHLFERLRSYNCFCNPFQKPICYFRELTVLPTLNFGLFLFLDGAIRLLLNHIGSFAGFSRQVIWHYHRAGPLQANQRAWTPWREPQPSIQPIHQERRPSRNHTKGKYVTINVGERSRKRCGGTVIELGGKTRAIYYVTAVHLTDHFREIKIT